ncbi:hypothetical protein [Aureivirga sp. CE67]|uniref:hypothetical protein n=1 Tax=Aureivirga sp. CE67 TaxID=1788983 RepID=UPI0018CAEBA8|nr:hypothetical protein [Aureivirga sp. CE67]
MKHLSKKRFVNYLLIFLSGNIYSQTIGIQDKAQEFWNEVRSAAPYIFAIILLVLIIFNIGKVTGENRDYKGFFTGVGLYLGAIMLVLIIVDWLLTLSF